MRAIACLRPGLPVRKGRIDPIPYCEKAKVSHTTVMPATFDIARNLGGKRTSTTSAPLPLHLQPDRRKLVRTNTKRALKLLERQMNPEPEYKTIGPFKVRA